MKTKLVLDTVDTIQEIVNVIEEIAYDSSTDKQYKEFCATFKYGENIREFCRGIYNHFKKYKFASESKPGEEIIFHPSFVIREKMCDVKSLCIIYSKILQYHNISHKFQLIKTGLNSAYMYVLTHDEDGEDIHLHAHFSAKFDEVIEYEEMEFSVNRVWTNDELSKELSRQVKSKLGN